MEFAHHGCSPLLRPRNRKRLNWWQRSLAGLAITWLMLLFSYLLNYFGWVAAVEARHGSPTGSWLFQSMPD